MSKLKDKLKASINPDVSKAEAGLKPAAPLSETRFSVKDARTSAVSGAAEKKADSAKIAKGSVSFDKVHTDSQNCWVWPD